MAKAKQDLSNVTTDASIAADKALKEEETLQARLKERQEVEESPDMPTMIPKRWGDSRRLTFASPGTIQRDPFYIPEFVDTGSGGKRRVAVHRYINGQLHVLTPDGRAKYRWTNRGKIAIQKRYGFRFSSFKGLFDGSGLFEKKEGDTVWNGDVVLMHIGLEHWEKKCRETAELRGYLEGAYGSQFFQNAQDTGVPSFQDDMRRGVREMMT